MFPFDHIVYIQDSEGWPDCDATISSFQAHVEVRGHGQYELYFCKYYAPSLRDWVKPAKGTDLEKRLTYAANNRTGEQQIKAEITTEIAKRKLGAMAPAYRMAAE